jgi:hypothetical protein
MQNLILSSPFILLDLTSSRGCTVEPPPARLAAMEGVEEATNLRVEGRGCAGAGEETAIRGT